MNAWDNLPNAKLIDQVLAELRANPEVFVRAWDARPSAAWNVSWSAASSVARNVTWPSARDAARYAAASSVARYAAWAAILALIAYDDSPKYLDMTYEELQSWAVLSEDPPAVLLLPYVWAKEQIKEPA